MERRKPIPPRRFNSPFNQNEYGVIVMFGNSKFSVKTETRCYWCMSQYWSSEESIRQQFTNLHPTVLLQNDFKSGIEMQNKIYELINESKANKQ